METKDRKPHLGRNIARIRELQGMKQEALASLLGVTQQSVSKMEQSEELEDDKLEKVAKALGVSSDVVKNFREESIFSNYIYDQHNSISQVYFQFNPIEKIVELYERLLTSEREKIEILKGKK